MNEQYILTFSTEGGKSKVVRVFEPDTGISPSAVESAAGKMIGSGVFQTGSGSLASLRKVELQKVTRTVVL
jgi:hypothetical protein